MNRALNKLIDELVPLIRSSSPCQPWSDDQFFDLADRIAHFQFTMNPAVQALPPAGWCALDQLAVVTTDAFRYARVSALPVGVRPAARFLTSGTTSAHRGEHLLVRTDIYDVSALGAFTSLVLSRTRPIHLIALVPPLTLAPESSLSYMVDLFARTLFAERTTYGIGPGGLELESVEAALAEARRSQRPTLLFTTTLAAKALLEAGLNLQLPAGSVVLTTGGVKQREGAVDAAAIDRQLELGTGHSRMGSEYGMTEMLSQAYRAGNEPFELPPWCRVMAFEPASGRRLEPESPGLLRFVDLANIQSALVVQTADIGKALSDHSFVLVGRSSSAVARGCSLTFEELAHGSS